MKYIGLMLVAYTGLTIGRPADPTVPAGTNSNVCGRFDNIDVNKCLEAVKECSGDKTPPANAEAEWYKIRKCTVEKLNAVFDKAKTTPRNYVAQFSDGNQLTCERDPVTENSMRCAMFVPKTTSSGTSTKNCEGRACRSVRDIASFCNELGGCEGDCTGGNTFRGTGDSDPWEQFTWKWLCGLKPTQPGAAAANPSPSQAPGKSPWTLPPDDMNNRTQCGVFSFAEEDCGSARFCELFDKNPGAFKNNMECVQNHQKFPWIPVPNDVSKQTQCGVFSAAEEDCGTKRFCELFDGVNGFRDAIATGKFVDSKQCLAAHEPEAPKV